MMTKKLSSLFTAILLLCSIFIAVFLVNVSAMNDEQNLSGLVWQSNGDPPTGPTRFCIWVRHSGTWYRFPETETEWAYTDDDAYGLWWYSYVLEDEYHPDRWENGDTYRVQVDGEPWNDYNGNATSNGTGSTGDPFPTPYDPTNPANTYNDINYLAGGGYLNEQQWDVRTLAQIDLAPTNITAKGEKPVGDMPVPPATLIPIIFNVTNFGQSASGPFWVSLWNCTVTGVNIGSDPIAEYSVSSIPGGEDSGALPPFYWLSPSPPGTYHINITVDSRYEVPEYDEANNRVILHFVTGPDLNITNVLIWGSVPEDPFYVAPGELVQIFATVENEGQSSTGKGFIMALYNITGPNGSIIPGHQSFDYTIGELDVGGTATRSWNWTAPPDEGDYYLNITADYGDQILEANELNNHFTIHFNVTKIPITKINHTEPIYYYTYNFVTYWYLNSSTEIYFVVPSQFFPPYYTWYRIINRTTGWVAKGWTNFTEEGEVPFTLELWGEETYRIEFYSIDSVGAQEPVKNKIVVVDDSEPLSSIDFDTPKYRVLDSDNWNITSATNITLSAIDHPLGLSIIGINNAAGINAPGKPESGIFYRIQRASDGVYVVDWTEPTIAFVSNDVHTAEPFILPDTWTEGYYIIEINSTDNLGQKEINSTTVYLDNNGPTTYIYGGQDNWNAEQNAWEIDFSTLFTLDADDGMGSGVDYIEYRITLEDGTWSAWQTYTGPFNLTLEDHGYWDHTIQFRSYDNLGNRGQPDILNVYIEGDITPPRPPLLRLKVSVDDIVLEWEHSPDPDIDHYLIYKSTTKTGFNFSDVWVDTSQDDDHGTIPLRTTWNHTGAVIGEPEYYYCMRGVDLRNNIGYTSNIAGKVTVTFENGYSDFALPLEPFEEIRASEMLSEDVFTDDADTLYRYDTGFQQWMGHPKFIPASIDDFVLEMGEGYRLLIMEDSAQYTFTGSTGTSIRYIGGIGQDIEFRQSLSAEANENQVSLTWNATPNAISYSIYRASARMGTGSLTDYNIKSVAQVSGTSWTDTEATGDEYYYMVVADGGHGEESGTYALGVKKFELKRGYTSFSLVLDPKSSDTIANFSLKKFPEDEDTIYFYDRNTGYWQGHPRFLPENINNGNAVTGRGYMIFTSGETTKFTLIGL